MTLRVMLIALTLVAAGAQAQVYKWTDEDGVTHYGQRPPGGKPDEAEELGVQSHTPSQTREVPRAARNAGESLVNAEPKEAELDCSQAVANGRHGIDTMIEVGRKNYRDGYVAKAEYEKGVSALRQIRSALSVSACRSARGKDREFYRCISSAHNHVAQCGQRFQ